MSRRDGDLFESDQANIIFYTGFLAIITAIMIKSCEPIKDNGAIYVTSSIESNEGNRKMFDIGEHIISVPLKHNFSKEDEICQYPYHKGYKCVGVDHKTILYVNEEAVLCEPSGRDDAGNLVYDNFGISYESKEEYDDSNGYVYDIGEHIISVHISDPRDNYQQYLYHDGYETIDIAYRTFGKHDDYVSGCVLYVNTVPVKCNETTYNEELNTIECLEFATPLEKGKVKTLQ